MRCVPKTTALCRLRNWPLVISVQVTMLHRVTFLVDTHALCYFLVLPRFMPGGSDEVCIYVRGGYEKNENRSGRLFISTAPNCKFEILCNNNYS